MLVDRSRHSIQIRRAYVGRAGSLAQRAEAMLAEGTARAGAARKLGVTRAAITQALRSVHAVQPIVPALR